LGGSFFQSEAERVQVSYADGTSDQIRFVWVSEPISAGFFLYRVPNAHRSSAARPISVELYDESGDVLFQGARTRHCGEEATWDATPGDARRPPCLRVRRGGCRQASALASEIVDCDRLAQSASLTRSRTERYRSARTWLSKASCRCRRNLSDRREPIEDGRGGSIAISPRTDELVLEAPRLVRPDERSSELSARRTVTLAPSLDMMRVWINAASIFEQLWRSHAPAVIAYVRRRAPADAIDDAVAETFLVAWRRLERVPEDALPWLYGVARRALANQRRGQDRAVALVERLALERGPLGVDAADSRALEALATLGARDRELLMLIAWEGLRPDEAAASLGLSTVATRVRLHGARKRFASALSALERPLALVDPKPKEAR
jgi:RNA polymerase sigma-70 factor, ECF subfamily